MDDRKRILQLGELLFSLSDSDEKKSTIYAELLTYASQGFTEAEYFIGTTFYERGLFNEADSKQQIENFAAAAMWLEKVAKKRFYDAVDPLVMMRCTPFSEKLFKKVSSCEKKYENKIIKGPNNSKIYTNEFLDLIIAEIESEELQEKESIPHRPTAQ